MLVPLLVGLRKHKFYGTVFHSYLISYPFAYELTYVKQNILLLLLSSVISS